MIIAYLAIFLSSRHWGTYMLHVRTEGLNQTIKIGLQLFVSQLEKALTVVNFNIQFLRVQCFTPQEQIVSFLFFNVLPAVKTACASLSSLLYLDGQLYL